MNIYKEYTPPSSDAGIYHRFEDGVTYTMRIASEPVVYSTEFVAPDGETTLSTRYAWKVWNVDSKIAQVMQLPVTAYRLVAGFAADEEYGDPTKYNLRLTREGKGLDTKYTIIASPNKSELDADTLAKLDALDLIEVVSSGKGVSHVTWLKDVVSPKEKADAEAKKAISEIMTPSNEELSKPIKISDIPF